MARPKGTSQYPSDERIVDKMEKDYDERGLSPWAAAGEYLDEAEGEATAPESKRRRLVDKLYGRLATRTTNEDQGEAETPMALLYRELFRSLAGLPATDKAQILNGLDEATEEMCTRIERAKVGQLAGRFRRLSRAETQAKLETGILSLIRVAIEEAEAVKRSYGG